MNIPTTFLALGLLGAASFAHAAPNCTIALAGSDQMQFNLKTVTVSASCASISMELVHTGKLPVAAMGHNVVISKTVDMARIASAGMKAGAAAGYVPKGDPAIVATTDMIGGGAKTSAKFPGSKLVAGGDYTFFCSFPGHSALMKGTVVVTK